MDLDRTDLDILRALLDDGRATVQEVADRVGLQRPSVHARIQRLRDAGVLRGFRAEVDPDAIGAGLVALVFVRVAHGKGNDCLTACGKLADALRRVPEVVEFHTLAGEDDAVLKVRARDVRDLERVVMRQVSGLPGVERVRTGVVLTTHFERPPALPPAPSGRGARPRRART